MPDERLGPPRDQPNSPPPQVGFDAMASLQASIEMQKSLTAIETKLDRLIKDVDKLGDRVSPLEKAVDRVKTGSYVASILVAAFVTFAWWAIGDRITSAVHAAIAQQVGQSPAQK